MLRKITQIILVIVVQPVFSFSQTVFSITGSSNLFISSGQIISLDSLVLTPSAGYNITGARVLTHTAALTTMSSTPSILRSYLFSSALSSYSGSISIYYLTSELNSLTPSTLQLNTYSASWGHFTSANGTNNTNAAGLSNISFTELSLAAASAPLPLLWLSLSAVRQNGSVYVQWSTSDETNCKDYQVQKSLNGSDWSDPAPPQAAKNTAGLNRYAWTDPSPLTGQVYYRIRGLDNDGVYSYSTTVVVQPTNAGDNGITVYPNPATRLLTVITGSGNVLLKQVRIRDMEGRTILMATAAGRRYQADISRLAKGNYSIFLIFSDGSVVSKAFSKE
jgi:hypothetical protein